MSRRDRPRFIGVGRRRRSHFFPHICRPFFFSPFPTQGQGLKNQHCGSECFFRAAIPAKNPRFSFFAMDTAEGAFFPAPRWGPTQAVFLLGGRFPSPRELLGSRAFNNK